MLFIGLLVGVILSSLAQCYVNYELIRDVNELKSKIK